MNFYRVRIDRGKRKHFGCGILVEGCEYIRKTCPQCNIERSIPSLDEWFNDKEWVMKVYMHKDYYSDFTNSSIRPIVSKKAKRMLSEQFIKSADFGDMEMVSLRDLDEPFLKEVRDYSGSKAAKQIANDPPQYHRLLLQVGADLDFQKTNIELAINCPKCSLKKYRTPGFTYVSENTPHIIQSTWKGFDLFHVEGLGNTIFCTERFIEVYNQYKLTGLEFEQVETV